MAFLKKSWIEYRYHNKNTSFGKDSLNSSRGFYIRWKQAIIALVRGQIDAATSSYYYYLYTAIGVLLPYMLGGILLREHVQTRATVGEGLFAFAASQL